MSAKRGQRRETIPGTPPSLDKAPTCWFARCVEQLHRNAECARAHCAMHQQATMVPAN